MSVTFLSLSCSMTTWRRTISHGQTTFEVVEVLFSSENQGIWPTPDDMGHLLVIPIWGCFKDQGYHEAYMQNPGLLDNHVSLESGFECLIIWWLTWRIYFSGWFEFNWNRPRSRTGVFRQALHFYVSFIETFNFKSLDLSPLISTHDPHSTHDVRCGCSHG